MVLKVLIIISIILQTLATIVAIRLVRRTKYNSTWILLIIALTAMSFTRYGQYIQIYVDDADFNVPNDLFIWLGAIASLCTAVGVLYAHKLFTYIDHLDQQRKLTNKRILAAVLRTEEKTRSNFSKELHDGLGPLLSSAKISLSALARTEMEASRREIFDNTLYVVEEALRSLREISNNLSPHVLSDFGLARGIQTFIDRSLALHKVKISFVTNLRGERYDTDIEVIMYRVVCELVTNSLKHSGCSEIRLSLTSSGDLLELQYTDNGRGFNPQAMMDCGMGLSNINSRINSLNGQFDIRSSKGKGMTSTVKVNVRGATRLVASPAAIAEPRPQRKKQKK